MIMLDQNHPRQKTMQPWIIGITIRWTAMMNCLNSLCHSLWCIANSKLTFVTIVCGLTASIRWQLAMLPTRLHMKLNFLIWRYIWKNNFCLFALYELGAGLQNIVLICELRMVPENTDMSSYPGWNRPGLGLLVWVVALGIPHLSQH